MHHYIRITLLFFVLAGGKVIGQNPTEEVRAVWVSTAFNKDWPSSAHLSPETQRTEFIRQLDQHEANGMNTIIVQIRPAGDAFYPSKLAPWSKYLCEIQGLPPYPYYDPLAFMIEECHRRGMEFHAWFNPFRALVWNKWDSSRTLVDATHVTRQHPAWFFEYGQRVYFDPGVPAAREYVVNVIAEVVRNYDIDGVHFDDYFYPYEIDSLGPFDDSYAWRVYGTGWASKADWRRNNIDEFVRQVSDSINAIKPWVKFGVSPSGVWRNQGRDARGSATRGYSSYDQMFADVRKWLEEGWVDYVVPQLYAEIGNSHAAYNVLVDWWNRNSFGRHVYIGHAVYRAVANSPYSRWRNPSEIPNQVRLNRKYSNIRGSVFFSSKCFLFNPLGLNDSLQQNYYRQSAAIPAMPWKMPNPRTLSLAMHEPLLPDITGAGPMVEADIPVLVPAKKIYPETAPELRVMELGPGEACLSWEISDKALLRDTSLFFNVYRFNGRSVGVLHEIYRIGSVKGNTLFLAAGEGCLPRRRYTFVITASNSTRMESDPSNPVVIRF